LKSMGWTCTAGTSWPPPRRSGVFDEWSLTSADKEDAERLERLADALDSDREGLSRRWRRLKSDQTRSGVDELVLLGKELEVGNHAPSLRRCVAFSLAKGGAFVAEAVRLLLAANRDQPDDLLTTMMLAERLSKAGPRQAANAARFYTAALMLRPGSLPLLSGLAESLKQAGRREESVECDRRVESAAKKAIALNPRSAIAYHCLGLALAGQSRRAEAAEAHRRAMGLAPNAVSAYNLAVILKELGREAEAITSLREAIQLRPDYARAHGMLGHLLSRRNDLKGAAEAYHQSIRLDPDVAQTHMNLGNLLAATGDFAWSRAALLESIKLDPGNALAHYNLGVALAGLGRREEATSAYQEAIRLQPDHAQAHWNLGLELSKVGRFAQALAERRRGYELGAVPTGGRDIATRALERAERNAERERLLPAYLGGFRKVTDAEEAVRLAEVCQAKRLYAAAARLYDGATRSAPEEPDDPTRTVLPHAARAAVLASEGKGEDAAALDDKQRAALRALALEWLRIDLKVWRGMVATNRGAVLKQMNNWLMDDDFATVRDEDSIEKLPAAERAAWRQLWATIGDMSGLAKE
jgi:tetratricopeptide (TPR) repeat protein